MTLERFNKKRENTEDIIHNREANLIRYRRRKGIISEKEFLEFRIKARERITNKLRERIKEIEEEEK